jgi:DNA-binding HxlR family transcriptional regulator
MLTKQLRELERDLLIDRPVFEVIPPKVEYSLTEFGQAFMPVMESLCNWSTENQALMEGISKREDSTSDIALDQAAFYAIVLLKLLIELQ